MIIRLFSKVRRNDSRTTKWNLFFNYSSIVYNVIIAIALVPLYLMHIPSDLYGVWLATGNIITWMTLLDPGLGGTMQYKIAHALGNNNRPEIGKLIGNSLLISCIYLLILGFGAILLQYNILEWLDIAPSYHHDFLLALGLTSFSTILMVFSFNIQGINFGLQSSLGIGLVFTLMNIAGILSTIILLKLGYGLLAFGYAGMLRSLIYLGGNIFYLMLRLKTDKYHIKVEKSGIKELFNLLAFNFFGKMAGTLQGRVFEFLIAKFVSNSAVTTFRISLSAPDNSKLILIRPAVSISPILSKLHGEGDLAMIKKRLKQMVYFVVWSSVYIFSAFYVFNQNFVSIWVGNEYYSGNLTNTLICIFVVVSSISGILSQFVWAIGEMKKNNIATIIQFIVFLPISIWAVMNFGVNGLIATSIISYLVITISYFSYLIIKTFSIKLKNTRVFIKELFFVVLVSCIIIIIFNQTEIHTWFKFIIYCLSFTISYILLLFILSIRFRNIIISFINKSWLKFNIIFKK
jgi:O-antigen/teichoic acid export membrane protein